MKCSDDPKVLKFRTRNRQIFERILDFIEAMWGKSDLTIIIRSENKNNRIYTVNIHLGRVLVSAGIYKILKAKAKTIK